MTCPSSRSRRPWLRKLCSLLCAILGCCSLPPARAQNLDKPSSSIDEEITSFSFGPDNRVAYAVYRRIKTKKFDALEHDDIWLQDASGKRRRLLEGPKFTRGNQLFSYLVDSFRWSPDGHILLVQLMITTIDESDNAANSVQTMLFDDSGREVHIAKGDYVIPEASNAAFLPDNSTIAYLTQAIKSLPLFSLKFTRLASGSKPSPYEGRTFRDVAYVPHMNFAIAVEQDRNMSGPPRLQSLDLLNDADKELATLDDYEGGLSVSPSGNKVAYFIDREVLEVRSLSKPSLVARARIGLGVFRWSADESRILLKRAVEKKSGDLVWIDLPPLAPAKTGSEIPVPQPEPISLFHGLNFREFALSPDGRLLGVVIPGKRNLLFFPLSR